MSDTLCRALLSDDGLAISVATTTRVCRKAQLVHGLASTPTIALGRLMTAVVLTGFIQNRGGSMSLQVVSRGRLGSIFADVTVQGDVRGYIKPSGFTLPRFPDDHLRERRLVAPAVGAGTISVIETADEDGFRQSATELISGEIDLDVEHHLESSDQIPTALRCDVLLSDADAVEEAAGVLVQAMPGGDVERLEAIREDLCGGGLAQRLAGGVKSPESLLEAVLPEAVITETAIPLRWQCRCSQERVLGALRTFDSVELADMADAGEPVIVSCDFCSTAYQVGPDELWKVFDSLVKGRA